MLYIQNLLIHNISILIKIKIQIKQTPIDIKFLDVKDKIKSDQLYDHKLLIDILAAYKYYNTIILQINIFQQIMSCCHCCTNCYPYLPKNIKSNTCVICPRLGKICKYQYNHKNSWHDQNINRRFKTEAFESGARGISFNNYPIRAQSPVRFSKIVEEKKQFPKPYSISKGSYIQPIISQQLVHHKIIQPIIQYQPVYYNVNVPVQLPIYNKIINHEVVLNNNNKSKKVQFYEEPKIINSRSTVDRSNWLKFSTRSNKSKAQNSPLHPHDLKNMVSSFLEN